MDNNVNSYEFKIKSNSKELEKLIKDYLVINGFKKVSKSSDNYYKSVVGEFGNYYRYFKYIIEDDKLFIYVSMKSLFKKIELKKNNKNIYAKNYLQSLKELFDGIDILNGDKEKSDDATNLDRIENNDDFKKRYINEFNVRMGILAEIGFWVSIFIFISSLFNERLEAYDYLIVLLFNISGLYTKKRIKSIVAFALIVISFMILLIYNYNVN